MSTFPLVRQQTKPTLRFPYDSMAMSILVLTCTLIGNILKPLRYMFYANVYLQESPELAVKHARLRVLFIFPF